jgi:hypothetical protein
MRTLQYINANNQTITLGNGYLYEITSLEGIDVPDLTISEQKSPYQDGATPIDQLLPTRDIDAQGIIALAGQLQPIYAARRDLTQIVNAKIGPGTLIYTNDYGQWQANNVTPEGPLFANRNANDGNQQWTITFHCADPYWYELTQQSIPMQTVTNDLVFPITFPTIFSHYTGQAMSVYNAGDFNTPVVIDIYGPCTNPKITKTSTGEYIKINKTMNSGDLVEIKTTFGAKTVYYTASGGSAVNAINLLDLGSTFFTLDVGYNAVQLTDDASSASKLCYIKWYNRYIGV